jgi:WD40 repeat protein
MANGNVLLVGKEIGISISSTYGGYYLLEWNAGTGAFSILSVPGIPSPSEIDSLKRSADHKFALFAAGGQLALYSSDSDSFSSSPGPVSDASPSQVRDIGLNVDGSQLVVSSALALNFYDRQFNRLGTTNASVGSFQENTVLYSADNSRVYWELNASAGTGPFVDVVDTKTFAEIGNKSTAYGGFQYTPTLFTVTATQLAFLGSGGGLGMVNCTSLHSGSPELVQLYGPSPTGVQLGNSVSTTFASSYPNGTSFYFGGASASVQSMNPLTVQVPASSVPGPVNVVVSQPDGQTLVSPAAFAYGVNVLAPTASLLPSTGNPILGISGYGLMNQAFSPGTATIGGNPVLSTSYNNEATPPFAELLVSVPNGSPGPTSVSVFSALGTSTLVDALTYIPSATILPAKPIRQLLYDPARNRVYALTATSLEILDPSALNWQQSPLAGGTDFTALGVTQDGSKFLVVDSAQSVLLYQDLNAMTGGYLPLPIPLNTLYTSVAVSNSGKVFIGGKGVSPYELDLGTMTGVLRSDIFNAAWFSASSDGSRVFAASPGSDGSVFAWNSTDDTFTSQGFVDGFWNEATVRSDGSLFAAVSQSPTANGVLTAFFTPNLTYINTNVYPDLAPPDALGGTGAVFTKSGQTLLVPGVSEIDFFDVASGHLKARLLTPEPLFDSVSGITKALALDSSEQKLFAVSKSGLTAFGLPAPADQISTDVWNASHTGASHLFRQPRARRTQMLH